MVTIRKKGLWRVQGSVGLPGNMDGGNHFEIMAVANLTQSVRESKGLGRWRAAQAESEGIEVIRK